MKTKRSIQKETIIEYLRSVDTHPSADEIYTEVRKEIPNISLGTVYRNLKKLSELGEILRISGEDGGDRFDGNPIPHYHFSCMECSRVTDIRVPYLEDLDDRIGGITGNEIHSHTVMFRGICKACKSNNQ